LLARIDKQSFIGAFDSWHSIIWYFLKERKTDHLNGKKKGISVASGIVNDPTFTTLARVLFAKMPI